MKFGVEIETILINGMTRGHLAGLIRDAGVSCFEEGYNHATRNYWKIVYDVSVTGGRAYSAEIVSPILYGDAGLEELRKVLEVVKLHTKVDRTCGVHVHHDASNMSFDALKMVAQMYVKYEGAFDSIMPTSRRGNNNQYCRTLMGSDGYERTMNRLRNARSVHELQGQFGHSRYVKLNLQSMNVHGTVEFRQHSGTTDFEKLDAWIKLTYDLVKRSSVGRHFVLNRGRDNFEYLIMNLDRKAKKFLRARRAAFVGTEA